MSAQERPEMVTSPDVTQVGEQLAGILQGQRSIETVPSAVPEMAPSIATCGPDECTTLVSEDTVQLVKVGSYFSLWFALSTGYAVCNKRATNALPLPWLVATSTVLVGSAFVMMLWSSGAREKPKLSGAAMRTLLPLGAFHAIGHLAGTIGTTYGSVSFAQVVKAAGPVYACILSAVVLRQPLSGRVWLSLLPIVGGVALATLKELSFVWGALLGAVASDLALALRNILSKQAMSRSADERGFDLSPANMFGVLTCASAALSLPAALAVEGRAFPAAWAAAAAATPGGGAAIGAYIVSAGLFFYLYSEVAMHALAHVHPVTHAVGNTLRRVVLMLVSMAVFATPMTPLGAAGSALAISGAFAYAMVRNQEKAREKAAAAVAVDEAMDEAAAPPDWGDACDPWVPSAACFVGQLLPAWARPAWAAPSESSALAQGATPTGAGVHPDGEQRWLVRPTHPKSA